VRCCVGGLSSLPVSKVDPLSYHVTAIVSILVGATAVSRVTGDLLSAADPLKQVACFRRVGDGEGVTFLRCWGAYSFFKHILLAKPFNTGG
jgi:hypothetical protein